jgi:NTE family protein
METPNFRGSAYAVFKGGGIAGIAHVGALQELEKKFDFIGFAGTSAGSLVALLAAAGLTANEMRASLEKLELNSLVGRYRFWIPWVPRILLFGLLCFIGWPVWFLVGHLLPAWLGSILGWILAVFSLLAFVLMAYLTVCLGLVPKSHLRNFLIRQVQQKISSFNHKTTFEEFQKLGAKPLKVFTTDLSGKARQQFGETPDDHRVPVVEAVIASAAFPLFFLPGRIEGRCMTDGGVACNLPIFAFAEELAERRLPVFAFDLVWKKEDPVEGRLWIHQFLYRLIVTAVAYNDPMLIKRTWPGVYPIAIQVPDGIDVMNFDLKAPQRATLFTAGTHAATTWLTSDALQPAADIDKEREFVQAQHAPERLIVPLLRAFCREAEEELKTEKPRAGIFLPFSGSILRIAYHTFEPDDADINIALTAGEGIAGLAWQTGRFLLGILPAQGLDDRAKISTVKSDRQSLFCVPLFDLNVPDKQDLTGQRPFGVLVLDSSSPIGTLQAKAEDVMKVGKRWADTFSKLLQ